MVESELKGILDQVYSTYLITALMCFVGSVLSDLYGTLKEKSIPINILRIIISAVTSTILMLCISEFISMPFNTYIFVSFSCGIWGYHIFGKLKERDTIMKLAKIFMSKFGKGMLSAIKELDVDDKPRAPTDKKLNSEKKEDG